MNFYICIYKYQAHQAGGYNRKHAITPPGDVLAAHRYHHRHKRLKTTHHSHSTIAKTNDTDTNADADADADADDNVNTLYCICRRTASEGPSEMIGCDSCGDW